MGDSGTLESTDHEGSREEVAIHWVLRYWLGFGRKVKHVAGRAVCRDSAGRASCRVTGRA